MLQFRATSSLRPSRFRQCKSVRFVSEAGRSSLTAPSESASPRSTTTDPLASLDDILTQVTTGSSNRTRMTSSFPDSEKPSPQKPQNSLGLSLLTRLSGRPVTGSFVAQAVDGTQRTQRTQRVQPAVESAADGNRSASAVSLISRQTTQTGGPTADRRSCKATSSKNGATRKLLEQRMNTKTEAVNAEGLSEECIAEEAIREGSDERERAGRRLPSLVMHQTNLTELFASSSVASPQSQAALRLQFTKERGGDYSNYLPPRTAELGSKLPPADYAQLALGRNKQIPLKSQVGALDVIKQSIQGQGTKSESIRA
ncbi:hypothetical protein BDN67DRAFT_14946 [Paxillus ammoniavirescens]|nr:hypothetical protein BDN67DRAFT_14946 [Paxillus ammoniavirescens]